jgi:hypothetical protein
MVKKRKEQKVVVTWEAKASEDVTRINNQIKKNFEDAAKAIERGGVAGVQEFKRLKSETRDLQGELRGIQKGFKDAGRSAPDFVKKATDRMDDLNRALREGSQNVRDFDDEFSQASQRVALAGDVETGARTLGGTVGAFGGVAGQQVERGVAVLSEIPASMEAIGRLKPAIAGLPDALKSVVSGLGPTGLGLTAVAGVAAATFLILSNEMNKAKKEAEEFAAQQTEAIKASFDLRKALQAEDLGTAGQQFNQTMEDRERILSTIAEQEERLNQLLITRIRRLEGVSAAEAQIMIDEENRAFQLANTGAQINATRKEIEKLNDELGPLDETLREQIVTVREEGFTLKEVTEAVQQATEAEQERATELLKQAENARALSLQQAALMDAGTEQLQDRLTAIAEEREAIRAAIEVLNSNVEQTEDVTAAITSYNEQLSKLGTEQDFINNQALQAAQIREQQAAQEERLADLAEKRAKAQEDLIDIEEQSLEERATLEQKFADDLVDLSKRAADESAKALANLESRLADLNKSLTREIEKGQRDRAKKELDARIKAQQAEVDAFAKHNQKLQDIQQSAFEEEEDARQTKDFRAIFNMRRAARRNIQAEQRDFVRSRKQANVENQRARDERLRNFEQERQERLIKFNQDILDTRNKFAQEQVLARQNAIQTVAMRRQQFAQELIDLQQKQAMELQLRRQTFYEETGMIMELERLASSAFGRIQSFAAGAGLGAFAGAGAGFSTTTTNQNSVTGNVTVNAAANQSSTEIGQAAAQALGALVI